MDREGEYIYTLRPKSQKVSARLLCEVSLKGHVKVVTLRSTFRVQNSTLYPLELMLLDYNGQPASVVEKIGKTRIVSCFFFSKPSSAPGEDYPLPIDSVTESRITVRPDRMFSHWYMVLGLIPL